MNVPTTLKFKDSGVDWLGEIPTHWDCTAIKHIVSTPVTDGPHETPEFLDKGIPFVSAEAVSTGEIDFSKIRGFISEVDHERYCQKYRPKVGDIYMVKSGASTGTTAIVEDDRDFSIWSPLAVIRCGEEMHPRFVLNYLRSRNFQEGVTLNWSFGTQQNIGMNVIENLAISIPPLEEQQTIANFLDAETSKIDALVAEQRRLIELLSEKRQAVISHAVTKGLDPNVRMKPSGKMWIGDIPTHWDCTALTRIADRVVVGIAEAATHAYCDDGIPILRSTNIRAGRIRGGILYVEPSFADERDTKRIYAGDLVTVRTGNAGVTAEIPLELDGCQCFTMLITSLKKPNNPSFFTYWMNGVSAQCYFTLEGWGTAQVNISVPILKALPVPIPPVEEQNRIVEYLDKKIASFDSLITKSKQTISLLQERRTALISAAVTGKIDVRNVQGVASC